jgi:hypothetical protein
VINTPGSSAILSSSSPPTATSSPSSNSRGSSSNVAAIAGGVVGGVVVISATGFICFFLGRRMHRQGLPTATVFDATPQQLMDELRPQSSDGGAFVPPSLPETHPPPMRLYVRISTYLSQSLCCVVHLSHDNLPLPCVCRNRMTQPHFPGSKELTLCQCPIPRYLERPTRGTPLATCQFHHRRHTVLCLRFDIFRFFTLVFTYCTGCIVSVVFVLCLSGRRCRK